MSGAPDWDWRAALPADAPFLASLFRSTRPELALLPDALAGPLIAQQQQLQDLGYRQAYPAARHLVIETGGAAAGRLVLDERAQQVRVVDIAVAPPFRRQGLARAVLARVQRAARDSGRDVVLGVAHDNAAALRLYALLGFVEEERDAVRAALRWRHGGAAPGPL